MKHVRVETIKANKEMIDDLQKCGTKHVWEEMVTDCVSATADGDFTFHYNTTEEESATADGDFTFHYNTTEEEISGLKDAGVEIESKIIGDVTYHRSRSMFHRDKLNWIL